MFVPGAPDEQLVVSFSFLFLLGPRAKRSSGLDNKKQKSETNIPFRRSRSWKRCNPARFFLFARFAASRRKITEYRPSRQRDFGATILRPCVSVKALPVRVVQAFKCRQPPVPDQPEPLSHVFFRLPAWQPTPANGCRPG